MGAILALSASDNGVDLIRKLRGHLYKFNGTFDAEKIELET